MANPHPLLQPAEPPDVMHQTRVVDFFDRHTPIIYQKKSGPCPLFAICNLMLLKGVVTLDPDAGEVSQKKLLSLVAECLTNIKQYVDEGHPCIHSKNIDEALGLLPDLPGGINVNFNFKAVDGFEFTRERALFDLLDIPLYHGWRDTETAAAVGSKFNDDLAIGVAKFESVKPTEDNEEERTLSNSSVPEPPVRQGDIQEQYELAMALQLSKDESETTVDGVVTCDISESQASTKLTPLSESVVPSEQADKTEKSGPSVDEKTMEWDLIKHFFLSNPTHITAHGFTMQLTNSETLRTAEGA